ncbi:hypothetical protein ES754_07470 [Psychrobacter frigidicola]|uniref:Uncharacterized protein n=1 Tax=Psychrobacter frigidicola TaxID=45611 RepID=A0A5C7A503_9GAMM|nr:hypothetical protein [Psychrobacter frigidicola]TXD96863.1 hypothetical protein ES754_07470 [Psychrobacter frigidicola]
MSTEFKTSPNAPTAGQQRRQASILLLRLQWLLILLLIGALLWLYVSQQRFQHQVNERLQSNEQVVTRLNEMDDRLFAISQQSVPQLSAEVSSQAQNQLDLLRIQIKAADRLLVDNDDKAAIDLLRGLQWQLSQSNNEIAPALTIVIKQSLTEDIERLQAQSTQPSPWQLQNIAIQNIQDFLHSHERNNSHERLDSKKEQAVATNNTALTQRQLTIHEVIMTLNLASQASNMREQGQLTRYLRQARSQLQTLVTDSTTIPKDKVTVPSKLPPKSLDTAGVTTKKNTIATMEAPKNIPEVIVWLDKLIANNPTPTPLLTTQILDQPKVSIKNKEYDKSITTN